MSGRRLLFVPLLLLMASPALAQCRVEGVVRSVEGKPLQGAMVRLEVQEPRALLSATTGADGHYAFENVPAGTRVRIVVSQSNRAVARVFALVTMEVETINIEASLASQTPMSADDLDPAGGPSGEIGGIVRSAEGLAVPAARVTINETTVEAVTDSNGRYVFPRLPANLSVELRVAAAGFAGASSNVEVPTSGHAETDFALQREAVQGSGTHLSVLQPSSDDNRTPVRPSQVAGVPSLGQNDVFRALQFLPGVAGSLETSQDLHVRGGTPGETLVTYDGFTLYALPHAFGDFTALNMDAVEKVDFSKTSFSAADGGRLSGAAHVVGETSSRPTGFVDLSRLGGGGLFSTPLGDRVSVLFAVRQSYSGKYYNDALDTFGTNGGAPMHDRDARYSGGILRASPEPLFRDMNGKVDVKVTAKSRLSVSFYDSRDAANNSRDVSLPAATIASVGVPVAPGPPSDAVVQVSDIGTWTARGESIAWTGQWAGAVTTTVSVGRSEYSWSGDQASLLAGSATGQDYSFLSGRGGSSRMAESNSVRDTTFRVDNVIHAGFDHALTMGAEVTRLDVNYLNQTEVWQQDPVTGAFSSGLTDLLNPSRSGRLVTVFAQDAYRPFGRLIVSPGMRVTHYDLAGQTYLDPRVSVEEQVGEWVHLKGGWSIDHQAINRIVREDRMQGDGAFWALSDGSDIPVARVQQVAGGLSLEMSDVLVGLDIYYRALDDLTMFAPRLFPGVAPDSTTTLLYHGSGTSRGAELVAQQQAGRNTVWAAYTLSQVQYTYPTLEAAVFSGSQDQQHEFKVIDTVRLLGAWSASAAFVAASGRPYTPALSMTTVWLPTGATVNEVTFDVKNSARLPAYHRLDLSTQRDFRAGGFRSTLGVTVFNIYNRQNVLLREYASTGTGFASNDVTMMGRAVNVFAKVGF